jgi:hypothetical protein
LLVRHRWSFTAVVAASAVAASKRWPSNIRGAVVKYAENGVALANIK